MYTLQRKSNSVVWKKTAWVYGALAAFSGVFAFVYLQFSHGESSPFLVLLFAPALLLGLVPALLMRRIKPIKRPGTYARRVWNTAVATLSCGMLVRAIINISGRYTEYDTIYWILSGVLFAAAIALFVFRSARAETDGADATKAREQERG